MNYTVAWETFCNRFDKKLLTHNHIKAIFNISYIQKESIQIREVVDTLNKHIRALNALEQSTEHWDALLIYLISSRLDNVTARQWEKQCVDNELPTLEEFKEFLNSRASLLETLDSNNKEAHKAKRLDHSKSKSFLIHKQACSICKEVHHIQQCLKFLEFTPQKKLL